MGEATTSREERYALVLPARCRTRSGFMHRIVITDLSPGGCRIEGDCLSMRVDDVVVISPGVIEGQCGRIVWIRGNLAGVVFDRKLYGPVVEHLARQHTNTLYITPDPL
ncbi:MAG: PilZ domain-containing protein, partial [Novosphingobium sp.]